MEGGTYGYTGRGYESYLDLLFLRARWYAPESGTFLSRDVVESEPPYQYVRGNPINRIDPSGMVYCDPVTGYCPEVGLFLCSHTPGAYDQRGFNYPCIVNPNNVQIGGPPPLLPSPSLPPAPPASTITPDCDPEKPCRVILGANKLANVSKFVADHFTNLRGAVPYHSYLLVVDPNRRQQDGFESPQAFTSLNLPRYINADEQVTIYYFGAFSERALTLPAPDMSLITVFNALVGVDESYFGKLVTRYGLYNERAEDYIAPDKISYLAPQWEVLSKDSNCDDILGCFKRTFDLVEALEFAYGAGVVNSNRVVSTALRNCGLRATHPANNVWAPGWYNPD